MTELEEGVTQSEAHGQLLETIESELFRDHGSVPCVQKLKRHKWTSSDGKDLAEAVMLCHQCAVLPQCRDYANEYELEGAGVWAGRIFGRTFEQTQLPLEKPREANERIYR